MAIDKIILREVFDSRGNKTIEAEIHSGKESAIAAAASGASVGIHEVPAFPEGGTSAAISEFEKIKGQLIGAKVDHREVDSLIKEIDPTREKLGGNTSTAISLATAKLQAKLEGKEFFELFSEKFTLPFPIGNVIGGGVHAGKNSPEIQEFLAIPVGAKTFKEAALANSRVHKLALQKIRGINPGFTRGRDDEGAWAPAISNEQALEILSSSCKEATKEFGFEVRPSIDAAASEFYNKETGEYVYKDKSLSLEKQIRYIEDITNEYDLYFVEDPLQEDDFEGFSEVTKRMGDKHLIVGDDLITTNIERLEKATKINAVNAIIIKPNQIGSLSETEKVINRAKQKNIIPVISHRSGETTDASIAHLAVGFSIPIIKTGIVGGGRTAKLNELIRIEEKVGPRMSKLK